jgi:hypothetical protein
MTESGEELCPFCGECLQGGHLVGDVADSVRSTINGYTLQWLEGEPSWKKSFMQIGEPVGKTEVTKGSYALGKRCQRCRKIILDY